MPARRSRKKVGKPNPSRELPPDSKQGTDSQTSIAPAVDVSDWMNRAKHHVDPRRPPTLRDKSLDGLEDSTPSTAKASKDPFLLEGNMVHMGTEQRAKQLEAPLNAAEISQPPLDIMTAGMELGFDASELPNGTNASISGLGEPTPFGLQSDLMALEPKSSSWYLEWPNLAWDLSCWQVRPGWCPWTDLVGGLMQNLIERNTTTWNDALPVNEDSGSIIDSLLNPLDISCWEQRPHVFNVDDSGNVDSLVQQTELNLDRAPQICRTVAEDVRHQDQMESCNNHEQRFMAGNSQDDPSPSSECPICHRNFSIRKSLLRHICSVHRQRNFSCSQCKAKFTRKDTRDRHESGKHSALENNVKCLVCGRYVSRRAFGEHRDSEVCRSSDLLMGRKFENLSVKFVGADDDPYLAALRMLRLFGPDMNNRTVAYIRLKLQSQHPEETMSVLRYESCVVPLLAQQMRSQTTPLRALGLAALLLGFMAMAGQRFWGGKASMHFEGAAKIFRNHHSTVCECSDHKLCPKWSPFAPKHSEVGLLHRLLKHVGVDHRLLEAYTPEDETALTARLFARRE